MTNFRLFHTETVCRRQFQIWRKWKKVIQTGRKHFGKRRNCSSLCGNGLKVINVMELLDVISLRVEIYRQDTAFLYISGAFANPIMRLTFTLIAYNLFFSLIFFFTQGVNRCLAYLDVDEDFSPLFINNFQRTDKKDGPTTHGKLNKS